MNAVERGFRDTAEQSGREATDRGLAHLGVTFPPGQVQHARGGAEAREVPRTHRALDEVEAQGLNVEQHDGVDRPVQAQRHHERISQWDDDGEDHRGEVVDGPQQVRQAGAGVDADRSDEEGRQRDHDQHRQKRHENQLNVFRDDSLQQLVERTEHGCHQQRWKHLRAVVEDGQRQTEHLDDVDLRAEHVRWSGEVLESGEARQHDHSHDRETDPWVGTEFLGRVVGDHQRQKDEDALPAQVEELPGR